MTKSEAIKFCIKEGILANKQILDFYEKIKDFEKFKEIILELKKENKKITKEELNNFEILNKKDSNNSEINFKTDFKLNNKKKLEVDDFVKYFKNRFKELRNFLEEKENLDNLVSINKISNVKSEISLIGIIFDKKITKNGNIMFEVEDLTGKIKVLINKNKKELFKLAEKVSLDSVVGFKGTGDNSFLFVDEIILPDIFLEKIKKSIKEENYCFIGDLHIGSKLFMEKNFLNFIDYLNKDLSVKYLFIVGDLITGIGNYPNQEKEILFEDLKSNFDYASQLLKKIRKDVKIIISPGNHDGVRLMEPQPLFNEKFAKSLYEMDNVFLTGNPSLIKVGQDSNFEGFNILMYHGFSFYYYINNMDDLIKEKATGKPEMVMKYLLKNRHLAPTHGSVQYYPFSKDSHLIKEIPDIFIVGHTHKSSVDYYNNVLLISVSSWEKMSEYQEKRGSIPDFCKIPIFNTKTAEVKILDFE